jgi:hypothetical protein
MIEYRMTEYLGEDWKDYFNIQDYEELLDDLEDNED